MKLIKPMLLEYQEEVSSEEGWLYEPKFDGIRLLAGNDYSYTRHSTITTSRFPELIYGGNESLLDGELIALGVESPDDFSGVMSRFSGNMEQPILYKAFDIISYKNKSVEYYPIEERKGLLTDVLSEIDSSHISLMPYVYTDGVSLFEVMKQNKMEGIVAKQLGTPYLRDTRSDNWRKIINWSYHEVVVSGITFKPLSVQFRNADGDYVGGTTIGFTKEIRSRLNTMKPPFLAKVKSRGWTSGGKLRLPQIVEIK